MGKQRIIAETGAGQHGVATATAARAARASSAASTWARVDMARQRLNVIRMRMLGAEVRPVDSGQRHAQGRHQRGHPRLGDQRARHALRHRVGGRARALPGHRGRASSRSSAARRARRSWPRRAGCPARWSPAWAAARTRSASSGLPRRRRGGPGRRRGRRARASAAATTARRWATGRPGVLHGSYSYLLQDDDGQVAEAHSISAGLDYPGVGPEHSLPARHGPRALRERHRRGGPARPSRCARGARASSPRWRAPTRWPALAARGPAWPAGPVLVCLSGRGDKDVDAAGAALGIDV